MALLAAAGFTSLALAQESVLATLPRHIALNERQHVSAQPSAEDFAKLLAAGISAVIDLRPDEETPDLDEKAVVEQAGLSYHALPVAGAADLTPENVAKFDQLLQKTAKEGVLMHCASGNRVGALMALRARWVEGKSAQESLAIGKAAGLTGLERAVAEKLQEGASQPAADPPPLTRQAPFDWLKALCAY